MIVNTDIYQIEVTPTHWRKRWRTKGVWGEWQVRERRATPTDELVEIVIAQLEGRGVIAMSGAGLKRLVDQRYARPTKA